MISRRKGLLLSRRSVRLLRLAVVAAVVPHSAVQAEKIFASGFESGTYTTMDATEQRAKDIRGYDSTTGFDWEDDLEADGRKFSMNYCDVSDGESNPSMLGSHIEQDPENPNNKVFCTWQNDAEYVNWWSRVQAEYTGYNAREIYYRVRFRIDGDVAVVNDKDWWVWAMLGIEIRPPDRSGHSLSVRLHRRDSDKRLVWGYHVRTPNIGSNSIGSDLVVEFDTWQTLEFYAKAGNAENGHIRISVDGHTVADTIMETTDGETVWDKVQPLKVYGNLIDVVTDPEKGNKEVVKVWFDDIEIWDSEPTTTAVEAPRGLPEQAAVQGSHMHRDVQGQWYSLAGRAVHTGALPCAEGACRTSHHSRLGRAVYIMRSAEGGMYRHLGRK